MKVNNNIAYFNPKGIKLKYETIRRTKLYQQFKF